MCPRAAVALDDVRTGLVAGGVSALAFLIGQLAAWRELAEAGYFVASNPANTFFYLLTAVHGLHIFGGWSRSAARPSRRAPPARRTRCGSR